MKELLLDDANRLFGSISKYKAARQKIDAAVYQTFTLNEMDFNDLVFMEANDKVWADNQTLVDALTPKGKSRTLKEVVDRILKIYPYQSPIEVFKRLSEDEPWFDGCFIISARFDLRLLGELLIRPLAAYEKYNKVFKGSGLLIDPQIKAFDDVWLWDNTSAERVEHIKNAVANPASKVIAGFEGFIPQSKMLSYTSYMAERLFVMHRILKETGSIYLHCDPYASHYLKLIMDAIFGEKNFRNEIVWSYRSGGGVSKNWFGRKHDILLFYSKDHRNRHTFNVQKERSYNRDFKPYRFQGVTEFQDAQGRWYTMASMRDVWEIDMVGRTAKERLGYPTQKPLALYERIIKASSNHGDLVLDPFAFCEPEAPVT